MKTNNQPGGFTLIEMLVVMAIIGLLAALLVPVVHEAQIGGERVKMINNGRGIHQSVMAATTLGSEGPGGTALQGYPVSADHPLAGSMTLFSNSNQYFGYLVTNGVINVPWSYFSGRGLGSAPGEYVEGRPETLTRFKEGHNAWCVSLDLSSEDGSAPFLFTRNLTVSTLVPDSTASLEDVMAGPPFTDDALVVVTASGSAVTLRQTTLKWDIFNPTFLDNKVLRPGDL